MAKNLKLKIKNAQLAEALNLNKDKLKAKKDAELVSDEPKVKTQKADETKVKKEAKTPSKKPASKVDVHVGKTDSSSHEESAENGPKKKIIKATNQPSAFQEVKQVQATTPSQEEVHVKEESGFKHEAASPLEASAPPKVEQDFVSGDLKFDVKKESPVSFPQPSQELLSKHEKQEAPKSPRQDAPRTQPPFRSEPYRQPEARGPDQRYQRPESQRTDYQQRPPQKPYERSEGNRSDSTNRPPQTGGFNREGGGDRPYRPYPPRNDDYQNRPPRPPGEGYQNRPPRPAGEGYQNRPSGDGYQNRPPRPQGEGYQNRPQGEGYQNRPQGDGYQNRPPRSPGEGYQNRPSGDGYQNRPPRPQGEGYQNRPPRPPGEGYQNRPPRPPGEGYQNRPPRSDSPRPYSTTGRPYSPESRPPFQKRPFSQPLEKFGSLPEESLKDGSKVFRKEPKSFKPGEDQEDSSQASKKARDVKNVVKKPQDKGFDSRDRQGLREVGEEGSWRKKRAKFKSYDEKIEQIVRPKNLKVKLPITLKDLASAMKLKSSELIAKLLMQGVILTLNDFLDDETTIQLLGSEFDCVIEIDTREEDRLRITGKSIQEEIKETPRDKLTPRPPVVAFMGHVDHGKTSLIDSLRKSNIAAGEAGAITQHIGAFQVHTPNGNITVLDTPGHEAFSEMRERGATVTDVVILVVAGDEGIMQQTIEALNHAKKAKVPIVVAINKCDKPSFNADNVYRQLADHELLPEEWGGTTITVKCSALTGQGIQQLLEMLLLQAEILELKADKDQRARGTVIESQLHPGMGCVATVLVQNGTLKYGDALVFKDVFGRVKTMQDEHGKSLKDAGPSCPVKITGLSGLPEAGCEFIVVENEKEARMICEERTAGQQHERLHRRSQTELETLFKRKQELSEKKVLNLILRADVQGSLEALKNSLLKIPSDKVEIAIISDGVGQISESDIQLASTSNASIVGFHTNIESHAEKDIARLQVSIISHDIIYHLIDDVKKLMTSKLDKVKKETEVGHAEVKAVFKASQLGNIAGCQVADGIIKRNSHVKLERKGTIIWEGQIASLKRVKEDVREVSKGFECGIVLAHQQDVQEGDIIRAYEITYLSQEL